MKLTALLPALTLIGSVLAYRSYSGYQVLRTTPLDDTISDKLAPLLHRPEFDFWSRPRLGHPTDIMASPEHVSLLRDTLAGLGLQPTVLVPDVGVLLEKERAEIKDRKENKKLSGRAPNFDDFMTFEEIQAYLDEVVATFPAIATLVTIGSSYEGRTMRVLKLSNGPGKTGIWFDAAIHAREWAAPPVVMYAINELTENLAANQAMLDKNDFYFLPVANPDGYSYTFADDRLWRKTRSPNAGSICVGTDPNRNFDWHWEANSPCSETHSGSAPFSEPEVVAIATFIANNPTITFYVAVHSYGQFLLSPYADVVDLPPNYNELFEVGTRATDALETERGTNYTVGTFANVLYLAAGTSQDWAYSQNISLSYTLELPGPSGFILPPSEIRPVVTETWEAIKVFAENIPAKRGL